MTRYKSRCFWSNPVQLTLTVFCALEHRAILHSSWNTTELYHFRNSLGCKKTHTFTMLYCKIYYKGRKVALAHCGLKNHHRKYAVCWLSYKFLHFICTRDVKVLRTLFRSQCHSRRSWSQPQCHSQGSWSYEVLVSVSYVLLSRSQTNHLLLQCIDFWLCSVLLILISGHREYLTSKEIIIIIIEYSSFIISAMSNWLSKVLSIYDKAYRFTLLHLSCAIELIILSQSQSWSGSFWSRSRTLWSRSWPWSHYVLVS